MKNTKKPPACPHCGEEIDYLRYCQRGWNYSDAWAEGNRLQYQHDEFESIEGGEYYCPHCQKEITLSPDVALNMLQGRKIEYSKLPTLSVPVCTLTHGDIATHYCGDSEEVKPEIAAITRAQMVEIASQMNDRMCDGCGYWDALQAGVEKVLGWDYHKFDKEDG